MATDKLINQSQGDDIISALDDIATGVGNITYGEQTSSDKVVAMTGYQKESTAAAISPGDSLNVAIGKLEKKVDDNTANKVAGPQSATVGNIVTFANVDGKSVQDSEVAIVTTMDDESDAEVPTSEAIGEYITDQKFAVGLDSSTANNLVKFKDNNGKNLEDTGIGVETSSASALSNDDDHIPTSKLVKTEVDKKVTSIKAPVSGSSTKVDKNNEVSFQQASGQSPAVTVTGDATNGTVTIEHQTGSGFNHLPKSGADGKYLKWKTNDDGEWVAPDSTWPANPDNKTIPGTKLVDDRFDVDEANIMSLYKQNGETFNLIDIANTRSGNNGVVVISGNNVIISGKDAWAKGLIDIGVVPAGTYKISCTVSSSTCATLLVQLREESTGKTEYAFNSGTGNWSSNATVSGGNLYFWMTINNTSSALSSEVKAVITNIKLQSIDSYNAGFTDYMPYAISNSELTELAADNLDGNMKNICNNALYHSADGTNNNITYKTASDGTITLKTPSGQTSGSSDNIFFNVFFKDTATLLIPPGEWVYVMKGSGTENVKLEYSYIVNGNSTTIKAEFGQPALNIDMPSNATASWTRLTAKPNTSIDVTVNLMICSKAAFEASRKLVPYAIPNTVITPELIDIVDSGPKNLFNPNNVSSSAYGTWDASTGTFTQTGTDIKANLNITLKARTSSSASWVEIFSNYDFSTNGVVSIPFTCLINATEFRFGHNGSVQDANMVMTGFNVKSGTQCVIQANVLNAVQASGKYSWTDVMLCTKAAFGVSQKYVPYRPPYDDLEAKPHQIGITSESDLDNLPAGTVTGNLEAMIAGVQAGQWVTVRTIDLNTSSGVNRRRMQVMISAGGLIASRLYHNGVWQQWYFGHNDATKIFERTTSGNETITNISPYGSFQLIAYDTTNKDAFSASFPRSFLSGNLKLSVTGANGAVLGTILRSGSTTTYACTVANGYTLVLFGY